jgi:hypothetical protein
MSTPDGKEERFRRLSLDLRGHPPSVEEMEALAKVDDVPEAVLSEWLSSDDFRRAMRRYHEHLYWPNLTQVDLIQTEVLSAPALADGGTGMLRASGYARRYRQNPEATCGDYEQTRFDSTKPGDFVPALDGGVQVEVFADGGTILHEGWRWVAPFWDKTQQVKVCAFDAQESATGKTATGATVDCATPAGANSIQCGCGPNLESCYASYTDATTRKVVNTEEEVRASLREQLGRAVDAVTVGSKPYTALLTEVTALEDGRLAHWKKHQSLRFGESLGREYYPPDPDDALPERAWTDATWTPHNRTGLHSGVLTLPGFLMRFGTNRARANRFQSAFLCSPFVPSGVAEDPVADGCDPNAEDLMQRCTCRGCHTALEPIAAHWGQFVENGTLQLSDRTKFPLEQTSCKSNSPSAFCRRFYVTNPDAHNAGRLLPWQWAQSDALHAPLIDSFQGGPKKLALQSIQSGAFARCTVRKAFMHFVGRELRTGSGQYSELAVLDALTKTFIDSGHDFKELVRGIVALPQYRRSH